MRLEDLTGQILGYWTVLERAEDRCGQVSWRCRCICGNERLVFRTALRRTKWPSRSCGCRTGELITKAKETHGRARKKNPTYQVWVGMRARCRLPYARYKAWNGQGVKVCKRWLKFENFLDDMGEKPEGRSLDRYPDPAGDYEPKNCRWATPKEQAANKRTTSNRQR
jgi:hypothetical protein